MFPCWILENWFQIIVFGNFLDISETACRPTRDNKSTWNRKNTIDYDGVLTLSNQLKNRHSASIYYLQCIGRIVPIAVGHSNREVIIINFDLEISSWRLNLEGNE